MRIYLQITLDMPAKYVAIIPLTTYLGGLCTSLAMTKVNRQLGRKTTFILGCVLGVIACVWIKFYPKNSDVQIFFVAVLIGAGGSTMLVTALSTVADLIGRNSESGAFIYGFMSLTDKVSNGVAVVIIQHFIPPLIDTCDHARCTEVFGFTGRLGTGNFFR